MQHLKLAVDFERLKGAVGCKIHLRCGANNRQPEAVDDGVFRETLFEFGDERFGLPAANGNRERRIVQRLLSAIKFQRAIFPIPNRFRAVQKAEAGWL